MNYPCGLIRDLLPLYHDDICSPESRSAIEAHCSECADCKKMLDALRTAPEPQTNMRDAASTTGIIVSNMNYRTPVCARSFL